MRGLSVRFIAHDAVHCVTVGRALGLVVANGFRFDEEPAVFDGNSCTPIGKELTGALSNCAT